MLHPIERIQRVLTESNWQWGLYPKFRTPNTDEVEQSVNSLIHTLNQPDTNGPVSSGGIVVKNAVVEGVVDIYVQVGSWKDGKFYNVFTEDGRFNPDV